MLQAIIGFSVRRSSWILAAALLLAVGGFLALQQTPVDAVPDLSENQVMVFAEWAGHGPVEVERRVTRRISQALQALPQVAAVRGSSDMGYALVHVIFEDAISPEEARQALQERLSGVSSSLPPGVVPQLAAEGIATGQIYWYTVESSSASLVELRRIQDEQIAPLLSAVPGVSEVAGVGGFHAELQIQANPTLLVQRGLSVADLVAQLRSAETAGGQVVQKEGAEYVLQLRQASAEKAEEVLDRWRLRVLRCADGAVAKLDDVADVSFSVTPRRGAFEKDGSECVAGSVHMRQGGNVPQVTAAVTEKLLETAAGLPVGVRIVPCYDRRPLISGAIWTVSRTLLEALAIAAVCVLIVLRHFRSWLVIAVTLPLCVLGTFAAMLLLNVMGVLSIQTNIMSLAGIVISIGVLVDSSIVMTESVMHRLQPRYGEHPVRGEISEDVTAACSLVGRPVFFSIPVMLVSFLPVFALGGIDGRMYGPLAWTKSLALVMAAVLAVTVVPALASVLVRGRLREETNSAVVRSLLSVYRPLLDVLLDRPLPLVALLCVTLIPAAAPLGSVVLRLAIVLAVAGCALAAGTWRASIVCGFSLVLVGVLAGSVMRPLGTSLRLPLDEGMVMDMPITVPRASITQSLDDMKARNMVLCRFPEIRMVSGKAGRADTPFDPAPLDMIESMVEFLPAECWPQRLLSAEDARGIARDLVRSLQRLGMIESVEDRRVEQFCEAALSRFDAVQRETAWQLQQSFRIGLRQRLGRVALEVAGDRWSARDELLRPLQPADVGLVQNAESTVFVRDLEMSASLLTVASWLRFSRSVLKEKELIPDVPVQVKSALRAFWLFGGSESLAAGDAAACLAALQAASQREWSEFTSSLNVTLQQRAVPAFLHLVCDEVFAGVVVQHKQLRRMREQILQIRSGRVTGHASAGHEHGFAGYGELPFADPVPEFDAVRKGVTERWSGQVRLQRHQAGTLTGFGGELDRSVQMPGWTNVWTRPIQNRVDLLATGVNSEVGVRVQGKSLEDVVRVSEEVAAILRELPGAADVVADPIRGKGAIEVLPDYRRAAELGVTQQDLAQAVEFAYAGRVAGVTSVGGGELPVRLGLLPAGEASSAGAGADRAGADLSDSVVDLWRLGGCVDHAVDSTGSIGGWRLVSVAAGLSIFCGCGCWLYRL